MFSRNPFCWFFVAAAFCLVTSCNVLTPSSATTEPAFHPGVSKGPGPKVSVVSVENVATDDAARFVEATSQAGVAVSGGKVQLGTGENCNGATQNCSDLDESWTPKWGSLKGYWKLNEASGASTVENTANAAVPATAHGVTFGGNGKVRTGAVMNGTSDYIDAGNIPALSITGALTIAFWMKTSHWNHTWEALVTKGDNAYRIARAGNGDFLNFALDGSTNFNSSTPMADGQWHHVVAVHSPADSRGYIYIDGRLEGTAFASGTIQSNTVHLAIGENLQATGRFFGGSLDDVAVWNADLSAAEVATLYARQSPRFSGTFTSRVFDAGVMTAWSHLTWLTNLPALKELPSLSASESSTEYADLKGSDGTTATQDLMRNNVALWRMNGALGSVADGTALTDASLGAHAGVLKNANGTGLEFSRGVFGSSLTFDGVDDFVETMLPQNAITARSVSMWIRSAYTGGRVELLTTRAANGSGTSLSMTFGNSTAGVVGFGFQFDGSACDISSTQAINDNQWHHVVGTWAATSGTTLNLSQLKLYIDGTQVTSFTSVDGCFAFTSPVSGGRNAVLARSLAWNQLWSGSLDETSVWDRELSSAEVEQLYLRGASRVQFQVKSCALADCSDNLAWRGPDGTALTYFSELNNNSAPLTQTGNVLPTPPNLPLASFTNPASANRYFQYRAVLATDATPSTQGPQLKTVQARTAGNRAPTLHTVRGTCSDEGRPVTVVLSEGSNRASGIATCVDGVFVASVDISALGDGTLTVTATQTNAQGVSGSGTGTYTGSNTAAPLNASGLGWTEGLSSINFTVHAAWTPSASGDLANQYLQFYTGSCAANDGPLVNLGSKTTNTYAFTGANGTSYSYRVTSVDTNGNRQESPCSATMTLGVVLTDDSNIATSPSLQQGTHLGTAWSTNKIALSTTTNHAELDATWTPHFAGLLGYWKFNGNGTVANNATVPATVGADATARNTNGTGMTYGSGKLNQGISFDGSDDDVYFGSIWGSAITNATVSFWFNPTTTTDNQTLFARDYRGTPESFEIFTHTGSTILLSAGGNEIVSSTKYRANQWNHLVATIAWNGTNYIYSLYLNGQLDSHWTYSSSVAAGSVVTGVGRRSVHGIYHLTGAMDEVAIWDDVALSATDVQNIYARQSAAYAGTFTSRIMKNTTATVWSGLKWLSTLPFGKELPDGGTSEVAADYSSIGANLMSGNVALWHLNEGVGASTAADTSGHSPANPGTVGSGVTLGEAGKLHTAAKFDGTANAKISVPDAAAIRFNGPFSISVWSYAKAPGTLVSKAGDNLNLPGYFLYQTYAGQYRFSILPGDGTTQDVVEANATDYLDAWHHVVGTFDGSHLRIYVDGLLKNTSPAGGYSFAGTDPLCLGDRYSCSGSYNFNGSLDEVGLWNRELTGAEVTHLYRRGANRLKFQVRFCTTANCSDRAATGDWLGPDGSSQSYFSELQNNSAINASGLPSGNVLASFADLAFSWFTSLTVPSRQFFQYRAVLETDDTATSPDVRSVTVTP